MRCQRCIEMNLPCSEKRLPGADRALRRLDSLSTAKLSKRLRYQGPHEIDILPNDRWETYQTHFMYLRQAVHHFDLEDCGTKAERLSCKELESYLRYAILEDKRWQPATSTSAIITLSPKGGISRRYWVDGTLFGLRYTNGKIRELALLVETYPRFPTLRSLEEYVRSRLPYENMSQEEIECLARQIDKRFFVVGRTDVHEFLLQRTLKWDKANQLHYTSIVLQWDIPPETWGFIT